MLSIYTLYVASLNFSIAAESILGGVEKRGESKEKIMVVLVVQSISLKECIIAIYFNIFFKSQHTFRGLNSDGILRLSYDATLG